MPPDPLAILLRRLFARLHADAAHQLQRGRRKVDLYHWREPMEEAILPYLLHHYRQGMQRFAVPRAKTLRHLRTKDVAHREPGGFFGGLTRRILEPVRRIVANLVSSLLDTFTRKVDEAAEQHRGADLDLKLREIFDPVRADGIADDEGFRAGNAGLVTAAGESGEPLKMQWVAQNGACPKCALLDGKVVALGEPFGYDPEARQYAEILHPPAHPRCRCLIVPVREELAV